MPRKGVATHCACAGAAVHTITIVEKRMLGEIPITAFVMRPPQCACCAAAVMMPTDDSDEEHGCDDQRLVLSPPGDAPSVTPTPWSDNRPRSIPKGRSDTRAGGGIKRRNASHLRRHASWPVERCPRRSSGVARGGRTDMRGGGRRRRYE